MTDGDFSLWIGRSRVVTDTVDPAPLRRLAASLGDKAERWLSGIVPPLAHWLYHLPEDDRSTLGADGHPVLGEFLPPVPEAKRMWAGGRVAFRAPIAIGAVIEKRTTIAAITQKEGRTGAMTLVTLRHEISVDGTCAIEEDQDLVFLPRTPPAPPRAIDVPAPMASRAMTTDAAMLFRFSALTFNGHRIHYDRDYARDVEGYPDLVVHGPLQALLLMNLALENGARPNRFSYRGHAPLIVDRPFTIAGNGPLLWVRDDCETVTMTARID